MTKIGLFLLIYAMCVLAKEKANLDIVVYEPASDADGGWHNTYTTNLNGNFSVAGKALPAEGPLLQMHPSGLCNIFDDEDIIEYGSIGVVKMEDPAFSMEHCDLSLFLKIKRAMKRGVAAMIIDITEDPRVAEELSKSRAKSLDKPVVLLNGRSAEELMKIVTANKKAHARIRVKQIVTPITVKTPQQLPASQATSEQGSSNDMMDMGIFIGCIVLVFLICLVFACKFKFRQQDRQVTLLEQAQNVVSRLKTYPYVYKGPARPRSRASDVHSLDSNAELCAICLEEYKDGQELMALPCDHEFHKTCVYSWLIQQHTCPLCVENILEHSNNKTNCSRSRPRPAPTSPQHSIINIPLQTSRRLSGGSDSVIILPATVDMTTGPHTLRGTVRSHAADDQSLSSTSYVSHKSRIYKKHSSNRGVDSRTRRSEHVALLPVDRKQSSDCKNGPSYRKRERFVHFHQDESDSWSSERQSTSDGGTLSQKSDRGKQVRKSSIKRSQNHHSQDYGTKHVTDNHSVQIKERTQSDTIDVCHCCKKKMALPERTCSETDLQAEFSQSMLSPGDCCGRESCDCHVDSNHSTYGSSDTVPSDISSCDSNVYSTKRAKEFKDSSTQVLESDSPLLPAVRLTPQCLETRSRSCRPKYVSSVQDNRLSDSSCSSEENERFLRSLVQRATSHHLQENMCPVYMETSVIDIDNSITPLITENSACSSQCCNTRQVLPGIHSPYDLRNMQSAQHSSPFNTDLGVTLVERRAFINPQPEHRSNYCSMLAEQFQLTNCYLNSNQRYLCDRRKDEEEPRHRAKRHRCDSAQVKQKRSRSVVVKTKGGVSTTKHENRDHVEGDAV